MILSITGVHGGIIVFTRSLVASFRERNIAGVKIVSVNGTAIKRKSILGPLRAFKGVINAKS